MSKVTMLVTGRPADLTPALYEQYRICCREAAMRCRYLARQYTAYARGIGPNPSRSNEAWLRQVVALWKPTEPVSLGQLPMAMVAYGLEGESIHTLLQLLAASTGGVLRRDDQEDRDAIVNRGMMFSVAAESIGRTDDDWVKLQWKRPRAIVVPLEVTIPREMAQGSSDRAFVSQVWLRTCRIFRRGYAIDEDLWYLSSFMDFAEQLYNFENNGRFELNQLQLALVMAEVYSAGVINPLSDNDWRKLSAAIGGVCYATGSDAPPVPSPAPDMYRRFLPVARFLSQLR